MNARQQWQRELVRCALHRASGPRRADAAFLEEVTALAMEHGAEPADLSDLTVPKLSGCLRGLQHAGRVVVVASVIDARQGREVPTYAPANGYDAHALPPRPPRESPDRLAVIGMREGRKLARRLGTAKPDPHKVKLDKFFRDWTNDSAGVLLEFKRKIDDLVTRYDKRYQALVEEVEG